MDDLTKLERELKGIYKQAAKEAQDKVNAFYARFKQLDTIKQKQVKEGKLDKDVYLTWRKNKMLMGQKYQDLVNTLTKDMTNTNKIAASIVNGYTPEAYANGMNFGTYEIEHGTRMNTSFSLYNRQAVEKLIHEDPDIIPWVARVDIPKDLRWNRQHITNAITQGILQGESIPRVAKRLQGVAAMNNTQAVRTARTAMTAANNAGHLDAFERAQKMGIKVKKQWLAALDSRTRDSHAALDGEIVPLNKKFSNGLMYPGDPSGKPAEVYNCRCRQIADIEGVDQGKIDDMTLRNDYKLGNMSYNEWKAHHEGRLHRNIQVSSTSRFNKPSFYSPIKITPNAEQGFTQEDIDRINKRFEELDAIWHANVHEVVDTLFDAQRQWDHDVEVYTEHLVNSSGYSKRKAERIAKEAFGERPTKAPILQGGTFDYDTNVMCLNPGSVHTLGDLSADIEHKAKMRERNEKRAAEGKKLRTLGNVVNTPEGVFIHEYGHAIDATYGVRNHPKFKELYGRYTEEDIAQGVSLYASENEFEFIAECFADSFMGEEQSKMSKEFMKVLGEIVNGTA